MTKSDTPTKSEGAKKKPLRQRHQWLTFAVLNLVFVIAPFVLYYAYFYDSRTEQEETRKFRVLSQLEESLNASIGNLDKVYNYFDPKVDSGTGEDSRNLDLANSNEAVARAVNKLRERAAPWLSNNLLEINKGRADLVSKLGINSAGEFLTPQCAPKPVLAITTETHPQLVKFLKGPNDQGSPLVWLHELQAELRILSSQLIELQDNECGLVDDALASVKTFKKRIDSVLRVTTSFLEQDILDLRGALSGRDYVTQLRRNPVFRRVNLELCSESAENRSIACDDESPRLRYKPDRVEIVQGRPGATRILKLPLADLIGAFTGPVADEFDQLILADDQGEIVYVASPRVDKKKLLNNRIGIDPFRHDFVRYGNVRELLTLKRSSDGNRTDTGLSPKRFPAVDNGPKESARSSQGIYHSDTRIVEASNVEFRAFIQPTRLTILKPGTEKAERSSTRFGSWHLIGVIKESRFRNMALSASVVTTGPSILLLIAGLSLIPLFWLMLSDRHLRLSQTSIATVMFGAMVLSASLALLGTNFLYSGDLSRQNQETLKGLNNEIQRRFAHELTTKLDLLHRTYKTLLTRYEKIDPTADSRSVCQPKDFLEEGSTRPAFNSLVLISSDGLARDPICSRRSSSPKKIDLASRGYFQQPATGRAWYPPQDSAFGRFSRSGFFVDRIYSYLDGRREAIISVPIVRTQEHQSDSSPAVAAMVTDFQTLQDAVLPTHSSFVLIDAGSGRVLFHSMDDRSLAENFIEETGGNPSLVAKLSNKTAGHLQLEYGGESVDAYYAPIAGLPLALVTFGGNDINSELLFRSLITAASLVSMIFLITIAFALVLGSVMRVALTDSKGPFAWFWASEESAGAQAWTAGFVVLQLSILAVFTGTADVAAKDALLLCLSVPMQGLILLNALIYTDARTRTVLMLASVVLLLVFALWQWNLLVLLLHVFALGLAFYGGSNTKVGIWQYRRVFRVGFCGMLLGLGPVTAWICHEVGLQTYTVAYQGYAISQSAQAMDYRLQRQADAGLQYSIKPYSLDVYSEETKKTAEPEEKEGSGDALSSYHCEGVYKSSDLGTKPPLGQRSECRDVLSETVTCMAPKENPIARWLARVPAYSTLSSALNELLLTPNHSAACAIDESDNYAGRMQRRPHYYFSNVLPPPRYLLEGRLALPGTFDNGSGILAPAFFSLLVILITYFISSSMGRRLSGTELYLAKLQDFSVTEFHSGNAIVVGASPEQIAGFREQLADRGLHILEPGDHEPADTVGNSVTGSSVLLISDFESAITRESERRNLLERVRQCLHSDVSVIVFAKIVPSYWLSALERNSMEDIASPTEFSTDFIAWSTILSRFNVFGTPRQDKDDILGSLDPHDIAGIKQKNVHAYHQMWALSTNEERDILRNLANDGVLNPLNVEALQSLVHRKILAGSKNLNLRSRAFEHFVLNDIDHAKLNAWYAESSGSVWQALWPTMLLVLVLASVFLVTAGQDAINSAFALFGTIIAAIPIVLGLVGAYRGSADIRE